MATATPQAKDIMTADVITVAPDLPVAEVARLLVSHAISAVPVVDAAGAPLGMVSEGDLIGRTIEEREARRDWWLALLAEGEALSPEFLASLHHNHAARDVMTAPAVTVSETTEAPVIARLLTTYRIKRVPVVRDGHVVGIVSRADLLRALAAALPAPHEAHPPSLLSGAVASIERRFHHNHEDAAKTASGAPPPEHGLTASNFRARVAAFIDADAERRAAARQAAAEKRDVWLKTLAAGHVSNETWRAALDAALHAADRGETEFLLFRFPSQLCSDGGRAVNAPLPDWPATLRGEAAEIYLRWERDLRPAGFHIAARILDFPGGFPGDVGLFLTWDK